MKVFVISDTHDRLSTLKKFLSTLRTSPGVGYLIHLGDLVSPFTLRSIVEALPPGFGLKVVLGNNDADKILLSRVAKEVEDQPEELEICGFKTVLFHGFKSPELTEKVARALACSGYYDIVMYGHTHRFILKRECSSYLLNPGTLSGYLAREATYATIDCETHTASIIELETGQRVLNTLIAVEDRARSPTL